MEKYQMGDANAVTSPWKTVQSYLLSWGVPHLNIVPRDTEIKTRNNSSPWTVEWILKIVK